MDIPEDIPQDLIDKAECIIVIRRSSKLPSWLAEATDVAHDLPHW